MKDLFCFIISEILSPDSVVLSVVPGHNEADDHDSDYVEVQSCSYQGSGSRETKKIS